MSHGRDNVFEITSMVEWRKIDGVNYISTQYV
jgi:hypothetical protein